MYLVPVLICWAFIRPIILIRSHKRTVAERLERIAADRILNGQVLDVGVDVCATVGALKKKCLVQQLVDDRADGRLGEPFPIDRGATLQGHGAGAALP